MRYYKITSLEDYEVMAFKNGDTYFKVNGLPEGKKIKIHDTVCFSPSDGHHKGLRADFPFYGSSDFLALRSKAYEVFKEHLRPYGVFCPVAADDGDTVYLFNCNRIDALNEKETEFLCYIPEKKIGYLKKIVLHKDKMDGRIIFRVKMKTSPVIVSEDFVRIYKDNKLNSLGFEEIDLM